MKHPLSCSLLNVARFSAVVTGMSLSLSMVDGTEMGMRHSGR